ncbi:Co2+/Mg2+ efflux protein ApaG [Emticicia agri]|uniref:Co2+/Mg2+ efflux protein ApaG n=1 Tax=Emticicia agri TaxID=2492393 RepID=A0A4Q5LTE0_9BACT|nr:Co2+/Mg2+ efflux protein ApaG [Emticicia agri]RYU92834.1 Co2+/Mg2+ efflux protein ApaG [Emticicia agri]
MTTITASTEGVKVSVLTEYQPEYSSPYQSHFVFSYRIRIENHSDNTVQLQRRKWIIFDSNATVREIEGEGVVGLTPILEPGQSHEYISGCSLKSSIGKMTGSYVMERLVDGKKFRVMIPEFGLIAPFRLN